MGVCQSLPDEDLKKEALANKEVTTNLRKLQKDESNVKSLLLLGTGESGKSTIFKQLKIIHRDGFSESDRVFFTSVIHANIVQSMKTLVDAMLSPETDSGGVDFAPTLEDYESGNFDSAQSKLTKFIESGSHDALLPYLYCARSLVRLSLDRVPLALQDSDSGLKLKEFVEGRTVRGVCLWLLNRPLEAYRSFMQACPLDPGNQSLAMSLGLAKAASERPEPLPDGWQEFFDPEGNPYYHHSQSNSTVWRRPGNDLALLPEALLPTTWASLSRKLGVSPGAADDRGWSSTIQEAVYLLNNSKQMPFLLPDLANGLRRIWLDPDIQALFKTRHERKLQIVDSISYYMDHLDRLVSEPEANDQDIVMARVRTTGIKEMSFTVQGATFKVTDVGGQRSERRKWLHLFADVDGLMFVAAINEYDQYLLEDLSRNRMLESLELFEQICNSRWTQKLALILFLNKSDIFREKIRTSPLSDLFPEYDGGDDYNKACGFVKNLFASRASKRFEAARKVDKLGLVASEDTANAINGIFVHVTCATNRNNVEFVFDSVRTSVLEKNILYAYS